MQVAFEVELGGKVVHLRGVERAFGQRQPDRGPASEFFAQPFGLAHQGRVVEHLPDQAPLLGLPGCDRLGEQRQRSGARGADKTRQEPGAARIRHQADARECLHEARRARRQHDVAGERHVGAGAGRDPVHGGNDREGKCAQFSHQRIVEILQGMAERRRLAGAEAIGEVLAGAEAAARAGEQQRPAGGIAFRVLERRRERHVHGFGERVEPLRPIEGDDPIALAQIDEDGFVVHERSSRCLGKSALALVFGGTS